MTDIPTNDLYGQYATDHILLGKGADHLLAAGADIRGDGRLGFHRVNLFDETTPVPDEATGKVKTDVVDPYLEIGDISLVSDEEVEERDLLVRGLRVAKDKRNQREVDDTKAADAWIRQELKRRRNA